MSNTYQISPKNRLLSQALKREQYELMSPLARTIALSKDPRTYFNALAPEWYALKGIDRLCAVFISAISLYPLNAVESLIAYFSQYPAKSEDDLRVHFPDVRHAQWLDVRHVGGLHHTAASRALPENQQLALYQWAAWSGILGAGLNPNTSADIKAWDAAPAFVRNDPLIQQIIALKRPVVLQECIRRSPEATWDSRAIGLSLKQTGVSMQIPWYSFLDDAHFAMLMETDTGMHPVLGLHKPHLYQFPEDKLPVIQAVNPALFIHGVLHNRALRESPLANKWFGPMLEATFQKTLLNSSYVFDLIKPRENSAEQAKRFDNMLKQFAPEYMRLLPVYQSLHAGDVAYTKWAEGCARSLMAQNEAVAFPDLGDISEHTP